MEMKKFASPLYKPRKPFYRMTIKELCDHNKICRSLDKMNYKKIQRLEKLKPDILERKIKRFLERNNHKKTRKLMLIKVKTRKRKNKKPKTQKQQKHNKKKQTIENHRTP